jgi:excisionase family DNA binding protein
VSEAATRLGCSDDHVYRLIAIGQLDSVDIAQPGAQRSKTRVPDSGIDDYIKRKSRATRPAGDAA